MKKIRLAIMIASLLMFWTNLAKAQSSPIELLKSAIPHAIPLRPSGDLINFLSTMTDEKMGNAFSEEVVKAGEKVGKKIKFVHRGNIIEYSFSSENLTVKYLLFLIPQQGSGVMELQFYNSAGKIHSSKWFLPEKVVNFSKDDSWDDFVFHSQIVVEMMKMEIFIPHSLASRLSFNMAYRGTYKDIFFVIATTAGLEVKRVLLPTGEKTDIVAKRKYRIITDGFHEPTYEVDPKWGQ